jgi:2-succinyl-5-enolpyruvyl-6-hydroxy-3-cyclohexene-1-carboxylate synthase
LEPLTEEQRWYAERMLSETLQSAIGKQKGPIHINVPFSEPLYQTTTEIQRINQWILQAETHSTLSKSAIEDLKNYWNQSKKRLIIVGQLHPDNQLLSIIENLALDGSVAILVEHTSNAVSPYFISTIDRTLSCIPAEEVQQYMPDLIVSIGGAIVSKRIKTFLRKSNADVIRFGESFPFMDTFQNLRFTAEINPSSGLKIIEDFIHANPKVSNFGFLWNKANYKAMEIHNAQLPTIGWSDLYAMASIFDIIPENAHLHLANSSAVRYALLFDPIRSLKYWCNRGTSGIDGSSSTALGASLATLNELHVLVTGDLSFFYDSNALWNKYMHSNFRIIVINNGGGDIFNYIPGPSTTKQWKKVFVAEQKMQVKHIANQFGLDYYYANNKETLYNELESFFVNKSKKSKIIEIDTMDVDNSNVLNTYFSNFLTN